MYKSLILTITTTVLISVAHCELPPCTAAGSTSCTAFCKLVPNEYDSVDCVNDNMYDQCTETLKEKSIVCRDNGLFKACENFLDTETYGDCSCSKGSASKCGLRPKDVASAS